MVNIGEKGTITIGLIGTKTGVGVTHMGVMLAVFLGIVKGNKVAIVERNSISSIRQAMVIRKLINSHNLKTFYKRISTYTAEDDLTEILSLGFDYVIMDFGCDFANNKSYFLQCRHKLIFASLTWWEMQKLVDFMAVTEGIRGRSWEFFSYGEISSIKRYFWKNFKVMINGIPYESDPFRLTENGLEFLQNITRGW